MKKNALKKIEYEERVVRVSEIRTPSVCISEEDKKERLARILLGGALCLNLIGEKDGTYSLLSGEKDFSAAKEGGVSEFNARVYRFSPKEKEVFARIFAIEEAKNVIAEARLMHELCAKFGFTQEKIAALTGKSRSAVANTLRLLTLDRKVVELIENGTLSAGHARAFVKVPEEKQFPFAKETIERGCSVRETERAVKAFLTPPEILKTEKEAENAAKNEELKTLVERTRSVLRMNVSLIGNDKKGRLYIDYRSAEELRRFEKLLTVAEQSKL